MPVLAEGKTLAGFASGKLRIARASDDARLGTALQCPSRGSPLCSTKALTSALPWTNAEEALVAVNQTPAPCCWQLRRRTRRRTGLGVHQGAHPLQQLGAPALAPSALHADLHRGVLHSGRVATVVKIQAQHKAARCWPVDGGTGEVATGAWAELEAGLHAWRVVARQGCPLTIRCGGPTAPGGIWQLHLGKEARGIVLLRSRALKRHRRRAGLRGKQILKNLLASEGRNCHRGVVHVGGAPGMTIVCLKATSGLAHHPPWAQRLSHSLSNQAKHQERQHGGAFSRRRPPMADDRVASQLAISTGTRPVP
mmetsp:Transcript_46432/g.143865  ORF Transcript_46432/g.143865 Transcript_46432/m.143865 type:complete len:310 (+) Transcript_46432:1194-2123(+)